MASTLSDAEVQRFLVEGFLVVKTAKEPNGISAEGHADIHAQALDMMPPVVADEAAAPANTEWYDIMGRSFGIATKEDGGKQYIAVNSVEANKPGPATTLMDLAEGSQGRELQQKVRTLSPCPMTATALQVDAVYDSAPVKNALTAVLGRGYAMDASPIMLQSSSPGRKGQQWHKGQVGKRRHHMPRFVFAFYYPQAVTLDMGPTAVCARSQYLICTHTADARKVPETDGRRPEEGVEYLAAGGCGGVYFDLKANGCASPPAQYGRHRFVTLDAGDVLLVHYDAWHRGTPNSSSAHRILFKKYFHRVEEPGTAPSWAHTSPEWRPALDAPVLPEHSLLPAWLEIWRWMLGGAAASPKVNEAIEAASDCSEMEGESEELIRRLRLVGDPWIVRLPRNAFSPDGDDAPWTPKPTDLATPDGFPSEIAALRAAYRLAEVADESTCQLLVSMLVGGASTTLTAGSSGAAAAYNASYALTAICGSRPVLLLRSGAFQALVTAAGHGLGLGSLVSDVIAANYATYVLAECCCGLLAAAVLGEAVATRSVANGHASTTNGRASTTNGRASTTNGRASTTNGYAKTEEPIDASELDRALTLAITVMSGHIKAANQGGAKKPLTENVLSASAEALGLIGGGCYRYAGSAASSDVAAVAAKGLNVVRDTLKDAIAALPADELDKAKEALGGGAKGFLATFKRKPGGGEAAKENKAPSKPSTDPAELKMLRAGPGRMGFSNLREKYTFGLVRSGASDDELVEAGAPAKPAYRTMTTRQAYVTSARSEAMMYMVN